MHPSSMKMFQLLAFLAIVGFVLAREVPRVEKDSESSEEISNSIESRKRKPFHDLYFLMGGLQSLVAFFLIKFKIVVIATIIGAAVLAFKFFGLLKYSGYFYKSEHPTYEFPSYPGPPYTSYSAPHDHEVHDWPSHSEHYSRSTEFPSSLNTSEIMHSLANIDKEDCRARLFCEFENILARSPLFDYFLRFGVTRGNIPDSKNRLDCATHYEKCFAKNTQRRQRRSIRKQFPTKYPPFMR